MTRRKPHLRAVEHALLCEMREDFVVFHKRRRGGGLVAVEQVACDLMDGYKTPWDPEVRGLVAKRLITPVPITYDPDEPYWWCDGKPVKGYYHLTEKGARLVAPEAFMEPEPVPGRARRRRKMGVVPDKANYDKSTGGSNVRRG